MDKELNVIKLEDGIDYAVIDEIEVNNETYVYLTNIENETDFCIRKIKNTENGPMLVGLDDDKEFDQALVYFTKKYSE